MAKTSLDLDESVEGLLCYIVGWITGIVFLVLEKENRFVRFHAMQSVLTFLPLSVLAWVLGWIPFVGWALAALVWILTVILCMLTFPLKHLRINIMRLRKGGTDA